MLSDAFLAILACPVCKEEVVQTADGNYLLCRSCRLRYPVRDGIPVMLTDEAVQIPAQGPAHDDADLKTGDR